MVKNTVDIENFKNMIDMEKFKAIVGHYGADYCDGELNSSVLDDVITRHINNKKHIFELFGGKLRIEKEIDVTISYSEAEGMIQNFIKELENDRKMLFARSLIGSLSTDEFVSNTIKLPRQFFNVSIDSGMKVSKALMRLVLPEHQHHISTLHSMVNQGLFTRGKVVISIDPCDYVTMSSNSSGWRSCHRLDGGEFTTGPIAYLNDSSSVICYIESSKPSTFSYRRNEYTYTNKTWRQIALVSPNLDFVLQERQYPNSNYINECAVSELFKGLLEAQNDLGFKITNTECGDLMDLHEDFARKEHEAPLYYNDIKNEMFDSGNVILPKGLTVKQIINSEIPKPVKGAAVYCLDCGCKIDESDSLYCYDCGYRDDEEEY